MARHSILASCLNLGAAEYSAIEARGAAIFAARKEARYKTLVGMPPEIRSHILDFVARAKGDQIRLLPHIRLAYKKLQKSSLRGAKLRAAATRMTNSKYDFRRKAARATALADRARTEHVNATAFNYDDLPSIKTSFSGALRASRQLRDEMQAAILRVNKVLLQAPLTVATWKKLLKDPETFEWKLDETQKRTLQHARNLVVILRDPLEGYALARELLQRPEQNLQSLRIRFIAVDEESLEAAEQDPRFPRRYWERSQAAMAALKVIPADDVTFDSYSFPDEAVEIYRNEGYKLDQDTLLGGTVKEVGSKMVDLCTPIGEAMMELARARLALSTPKRAREVHEEDEHEIEERVAKRQQADRPGSAIDLTPAEPTVDQPSAFATPETQEHQVQHSSQPAASVDEASTSVFGQQQLPAEQARSEDVSRQAYRVGDTKSKEIRPIRDSLIDVADDYNDNGNINGDGEREVGSQRKRSPRQKRPTSKAVPSANWRRSVREGRTSIGHGPGWGETESATPQLNAAWPLTTRNEEETDADDEAVGKQHENVEVDDDDEDGHSGKRLRVSQYSEDDPDGSREARFDLEHASSVPFARKRAHETNSSDDESFVKESHNEGPEDPVRRSSKRLRISQHAQDDPLGNTLAHFVPRSTTSPSRKRYRDDSEADEKADDHNDNGDGGFDSLQPIASSHGAQNVPEGNNEFRVNTQGDTSPSMKRNRELDEADDERADDHADGRKGKIIDRHSSKRIRLENEPLDEANDVHHNLGSHTPLQTDVLVRLYFPHVDSPSADIGTEPRNESQSAKRVSADRR